MSRKGLQLYVCRDVTSDGKRLNVTYLRKSFRGYICGERGLNFTSVENKLLFYVCGKVFGPIHL